MALGVNSNSAMEMSMAVLTVIMCTGDDSPPCLDGSEDHADCKNCQNKNEKA